MIQIDFVPLMAICPLPRAESSDTPPLGSDNIPSDILRVLGGIGLNGEILAMLRGQVAEIAIGSIFLFVGLAVCGTGGIRRRSGTRIFACLGIWSAMYGAVQLTQSQASLIAFPDL